MTSVKKQYQEIVDFLEANANKKVATIMPQILEMTKAKVRQSTVKYDDDGNPIAIFCYYHKQWEAVEHFGKKSSTKSGYNTMCKTGVSEWTKQQKALKELGNEILEKVTNGELAPEDIKAYREEREAEIKQVDLTDAPEPLQFEE